MPLPRVRLVVLNYNGGDMVVRCIEHLERLDWPVRRLELVVVDNASSDGSDARLSTRPRVRLIQSGSNQGFPANNLGMRDLDGVDYVGLVNNDAFAEPGYLKPLVEALEADPGLGAVCPKVVLASRFVVVRIESSTGRLPDGREAGLRVTGARRGGEDCMGDVVWAQGCHQPERDAQGRLACWLTGEAQLYVPVDDSHGAPARLELRMESPTPQQAMVNGGQGASQIEVGPSAEWLTVALQGERFDVINNVGSQLVNEGWGADRGFLERDQGQYEEAEEVFAWCGAGVLFRPEHLNDVGLFDESFFMYYEDTDMAWRGRARGWRYHYVPEAVLRHCHAATAVEGSAMFQHYVERNRLIMLTKNAPASVVARSAGRYLLSTASYARRDVVRPLLRGRRPSPGVVLARLRSYGSYLRALPRTWRERRRLRSGQVVHDEALLGWSVSR